VERVSLIELYNEIYDDPDSENIDQLTTININVDSSDKENHHTVSDANVPHDTNHHQKSLQRINDDDEELIITSRRRLMQLMLTQAEISQRQQQSSCSTTTIAPATTSASNDILSEQSELPACIKRRRLARQLTLETHLKDYVSRREEPLTTATISETTRSSIHRQLYESADRSCQVQIERLMRAILRKQRRDCNKDHRVGMSLLMTPGHDESTGAGGSHRSASSSTASSVLQTHTTTTADSSQTAMSSSSTTLDCSGLYGRTVTRSRYLEMMAKVRAEYSHSHSVLPRVPSQQSSLDDRQPTHNTDQHNVISDDDTSYELNIQHQVANERAKVSMFDTGTKGHSINGSHTESAKDKAPLGVSTPSPLNNGHHDSDKIYELELDNSASKQTMSKDNNNKLFSSSTLRMSFLRKLSSRRHKSTSAIVCKSDSMNNEHQQSHYSEPHQANEQAENDDDAAPRSERLPTLYELYERIKADANPKFVPIHVSNGTFQRQTSQRRSLLHADFRIKRAKSHHAISSTHNTKRTKLHSHSSTRLKLDNSVNIATSQQQNTSNSQTHSTLNRREVCVQTKDPSEEFNSD
ncbi:hypothetical protein GZH46_02075, partial [Fragariocoptes setiger]